MKMTTPISSIDNYMAEQIKRIEQAVISNLGYIGETCVNEARIKGSYMDQSGNLRGSTGFVIVVDGEIVQMSSFEPVKGSAEGSARGEKFARELAARYNRGIVLIVVAGMNYAAAVSARGRDVLDSAELKAEQEVDKMMTKLGFKKR